MKSVISDQAYSLLGHEVNPIEAKYPLGTSVFIIPWIALLGKKVVFISGFIYFVASFGILFKTLKTQELPTFGLILLFIFLPVQFLSRSLMSEMPSLLLISIGVYLYFKEKTSGNLFFLGFIAGLSFAFRETNIVILIPLLIHKTIANRSFFFHSIFGLLSGLSFRFIASWLFYHDALFLKHSYPFSISFIPENLWIYGLVLIVLLPVSPYWIVQGRKSAPGIFKWIILLFTLIHLCYGYNATEYSGLKQALILNGRFFIPTLPLLVFLLAAYFKEKKFPNLVLVILGLGSGIITMGAQYIYGQKQIEHATIAKEVQEFVAEHPIIYDQQFKTSIQRYINPFFGLPIKSYDLETSVQSDQIKHILSTNHQALVILCLREDSSLKTIRSQEQLVLLEQIRENYHVQPQDLLRTKDGLQVSTYLISIPSK